MNDRISLDTDQRILMIDELGVVPTHRAYLGYARLSHACARGYARAFATLFVDKIDHNFTLMYFCLIIIDSSTESMCSS